MPPSRAEPSSEGRSRPMRVALLTNEYPPYIYGGAGVHVEYLSRELAHLDAGAHQVDVLSFGDQDVTEGNLRVRGIAEPEHIAAQDPRHGRLLDAIARNLSMAAAVEDPDVVHCHTWYSHFAGCLVKQLTGTP